MLQALRKYLISTLLLVPAGVLAATDLGGEYVADGLVPVCVLAHFHACGLLDRQGRWRVEPRYAAIYENGSGWTVERGSGLVGLLDQEGKELIAPRFDSIGRFSEGLAWAQSPGGRDEPYGFINARGEWVIKPQFMYPAQFNGGAALVWLPGKTYEDRRMALVDHQGKLRMLPYSGEHQEPLGDGRFVVTRGEGAQQRIGVIDTQGRELVPLKPLQSLELVKGGGWVSQSLPASEGAPVTFKVHARNGKQLFTITGPQAWIASAGDSGLARYDLDDTRSGVVSLLTGKVLLRPSTLQIHGIDDERIGFSLADRAGNTRYGYLDLAGREVIPPLLSRGPAFERGLIAFCEGGGGESSACVVLDRDGRSLPAFTGIKAHDVSLKAWEDGPQSPVVRDIVKVRVDGEVRLLTRAGKLIARIETASDCDAERVRNAAGEVIWPRHAEMLCALRESSGRPDDSFPALVAAYEERTRHEAELDRERAQIRTLGGGIENLIDPSLAELRKKLDAAPWITGPAEIALGDIARVQLPAGYRYLTPEATAALRNQATDPPEEPNSLPIALLAAPDLRWVARVITQTPGHVPLSDALPPPDELLETLRVYTTGPLSEHGAQGSQDTQFGLFTQWRMPPQVNPANQRLAWAIDRVGTNRQTQFNVLRLGRTGLVALLVEWNGLLNMHAHDYYHGEVLELADRVEFLPGQRYADHAPDDALASPLYLKHLVTGPPPPKLQALGRTLERQAQAQEERRSGLLIRLVGVVGLLVLVVASARNRSR